MLVTEIYHYQINDQFLRGHKPKELTKGHTYIVHRYLLIL